MQKNANQEVLRSDESAVRVPLHFLISWSIRDASQLDKLRQLGLTNEDEIKLEVMRDHIARLAVARKRYVGLTALKAFI